MNLLLLDLLPPPASETVASALRSLSGRGPRLLRIFHDAAAARTRLATSGNTDLLVIACDDDQGLRNAYGTLAVGPLPPTLVISGTGTIETAAGLLEAGVDAWLVRDEAGLWCGQLAEKATVLLGRHGKGIEQQRLAEIVNGCSVAMFAIDRTHRITHWNPACAALTGIAAADVVGTSEHWRPFHEESRPCPADLVVDGLTTPEAEAGSDETGQDFFPALADGGRWLHITAAPLRNACGELIGAVQTMHDISEQRLVEESLRQSEERFHLLSIIDRMTGLYNARHFAQRLAEEMDRSQRYRHPLALIIIEVDDFKRFNETWGQAQGDQVLVRLAECIGACLRRIDQAFRLGHEEFVVLLPQTDMDNAVAAAERLCQLFASSEINPVAGKCIRCTVSIGVTTCAPGESPRDFVARAESGTYEANRLGKNRVIRIPAPESSPESRPLR